MKELLNDKFKDEELDLLLEHLGEVTGDLDSEMEKVYKELMFVGFSFSRLDEESKDAIKLNLRLCIRYNEIKEDYLKIKNLVELRENVDQPSVLKPDIDKEFLENIKVNLN